MGEMGAAARDLARFLAHRVGELGQSLEATISVAELHRVLVPYPVCRDALGFATKAEYDLALLHLLREGRGVRVAEEALSEAVEKELASPEPGLAFLKHFAASPLEIGALEESWEAGESTSPRGTEAASGSVADEEPAASDGERSDAARRVPSAGEWLASLEEAVERRARAGQPAEEVGSEVRSEASHPPQDARCAACEGELPPRPGVRYCPHCGADQTQRRCGGCGEPLESEWKYCPRCGAAANGS